MKIKAMFNAIVIFPAAIVWFTIAILGGIFSTLGVIFDDMASCLQEELESFICK